MNQSDSAQLHQIKPVATQEVSWTSPCKTTRDQIDTMGHGVGERGGSTDGHRPEHQTNPCVSAGGAHDGESNQFIAASGATAPHRPVPDYHTGKKSLPSSPYHTISITPRGCKKLGEMRSKGLLPPLISAPPPGRSPHAELPKRAIIYCGSEHRAKGELP